VRLEDKIKSGDVKAAVLPAYMQDQKHWITIRIDFENEEISYGKIAAVLISSMNG
jgi:predicted DNA-binding protein (MmcQ/YjbR family)